MYGEDLQMRKSSRWGAFIFAAAFLMCGACTKHDVPSCSDENVKKMVLEKVREISRDVIVSRTTPTSFGLKEAKGAYALLKERIGKEGEPHEKEISKLLSGVDEKMAKMDLELTEVRLISKNDNTRTCVCNGSVVFTNKETKKQNTSPFEFTAQYTDGRKLNIEFTKF
jgi:hypothetical protein